MKEERLPAKSFRDLIVWRKAHEFVLAVYRYSEAMPKKETYGLCIQMRRAAVSIAANIAEGFRKRGRADKVRYMNTAEGSLEESRYYLILAQDLGYGETVKHTALLEEVSRILDGYSKAIINAPLQEKSRGQGS
jgi:four helix bundle protein